MIIFKLYIYFFIFGFSTLCSITSRAQSNNPGITNHPDVLIYPSSSGNSQFNAFIAINKQNPSILAVTGYTRYNSQPNQGRYVSTNGGASWSGSDILNPNVSTLLRNYGTGNTIIDNSGSIYICTVDPDQKQIRLTKSTDNGATFSTWQPILPTPNYYLSFNPRLAIDDVPTSPFFNKVYCVFKQNGGDPTFSNLGFISSANGGNTFSSPVNITPGPTILGSEAASIATGINGEIYIAYVNDNTPATGFKFIRSIDGGNTFTSPFAGASFTGIQKSIYVNPDMNNIFTKDYVNIAVDKSGKTNNGRIYATFAAQENGNGKAVIQITYSDNHGVTWSTPQTISYSNTLQSWRPWVCVDQTTGAVYVAYTSIFNSQFNTNVYVATSFDGGNSFITQIANDSPFVTSYIWDKNESSGDWIGITAHAGNVFPIWYSKNSGKWQNYVSKITVVPAITGPTGFCGSTQYKLANVHPSTQVTWSTSVSGIINVPASGNPITATEVSQGYVTLTASINGNPVASINISTRPTSSITYYTTGCENGRQQWYLSASSNIAGGSSNWQWTVDNPTSDIIIYNPYSPSTFASVGGGGGVSVKFTDACGRTSDRNGVTIYNTSCQSFNYSISPNPAVSSVSINSQQGSSKSKEKPAISQISIYDLQMNLKKRFVYNWISKVTIDVSTLPTGIYIVEIINGKNIERQKLQISR